MTTDAEPPSIPLPALGAETMAIIHDNLGIVLTYAFSKQALDEYRGWLVGNRWYVASQTDRVLFEWPRQRATRAIIELAVLFRALDDVSEITKHDYVATHPYHSTRYIYGKLYDLDGASRPLPLCDVPNKVIHAKRIDWNFDNPKEPLVVCHAAETEYARFKWTRAEVFVNAFAAVCAALASPRR